MFVVYGNYGPLGQYRSHTEAREAIAILNEEQPDQMFSVQYESSISLADEDGYDMQPMTADNIQLTHKV